MIKHTLFMLGALVLVAAPMTGCADKSAMRTNASLMAENEELRDRNTQLEDLFAEQEIQFGQLQGENRTLRSENGRLASEGRSNNAPTGFEGVSGVSSTVLDTGEVLLSIESDVLFDSGKASLKANAKKTLDEVASVLAGRYANRLIRISGHSDSDPIKKSQWKTNERLSAERALTVEEYLAAKGIANNSMYVAAFGPSRPLKTKKESRRVEIVVLNLPSD
ncbi:MAG: OmpA family protein [Phycisphaeraceae bacterium]|nr:OmpA family protein [Phycisphaeraceae bacterium]MCB9848855.1 OmpA family protein [Phycisphaeraceae bacterium]